MDIHITSSERIKEEAKPVIKNIPNMINTIPIITAITRIKYLNKMIKKSNIFSASV